MRKPALSQSPMFASLPRMEMAKLLADVQERELPAGSVLPPEVIEGFLWIVVSGEIQIATPGGADLVPLYTVGRSETFGESSLHASGSSPPLAAIALSDSVLNYLPVERFRRLLHAQPTLTSQFLHATLSRTGTITQTLASSRQALSAYANELWDQVDFQAGEDAQLPPITARTDAAASTASPALTRQRKARPQSVSVQWVQSIRWSYVARLAFGTLAPLLLLATNMDRSQRLTAVILVWAALNWVLNTVPEYAVALGAGAAGVLAGVAKATVLFGGFAAPSWFLTLSILGIGAAVAKSGLLYRGVLHALQWLPPTYRGQSLALALIGILITPLLPLASGRLSVAGPLARELAEAMRLPERGRGTAGLAMISFLGFAQMSTLFLNGTNINLLVWSILPAPVKAQVNWTFWLWAVLPLSVLMFIGYYLSIVWLYPPEPVTMVPRRTITAQLRLLGSLNRDERITGLVLMAVLVGFTTDSLHRVDASWIALGGFLALVASGVIDRDVLRRNIDWGTLLLLGMLVGLSDMTRINGLSDLIGNVAAPALVPFSHNAVLFFGACALITLIVRLVVPAQQAVLLMALSLMPVAARFGYSEFAVAICILVMSSTWLVPQQQPQYMTLYSVTEGKMFDHRQVFPLALVQAAVTVIALLINVPFWQWIGLAR